ARGEEFARARQNDRLDAGVGIGGGKGLGEAQPQRVAQRVDRRIIHSDDRDLALFLGLYDRHGAHSSIWPLIGWFLGPASSRPGLALGWPRGYSSATKHTRRNAHAARIDDGPAALGFERDRLCSGGVSKCRDRIADR